MYVHVKRGMDFMLSLLGLIVLSPVLLVLTLAVRADSPGPVLFRQKRVGIHKTHFAILKFRTMRIDTPKDTPTHLLQNPEQYITRVGKFLRRTSLDELPQIFNILKGDMAIVGPRPALWNQYDLIEERDKYGANDIRPGLTGWAQINGRDELEIPGKARRAQRGRRGGRGHGRHGRHPGRPWARQRQVELPQAELYKERTEMKRILIAGANSYIGTSLERYLLEYNSSQGRELYRVDTISQRDPVWESFDFGGDDAGF